jgi:2-succinyl-5-enolpyruvyl-6-hydroxy-3-cyclohexene-1-carboxylate synthase
MFQPDLLITLGGPVISKNAKLFLRGYKPSYHVDVDSNPMEINTYQCLTHKFVTDSKTFVNFVLENCEAKTQTYTYNWQQKNKEANSKSKAFLSELPWVDLTVYNEFFNSIDQSFDMHLGNSTPVRYAELFSKHPKLNYYCNRGTSGIDGSTSTAAGAAIASVKATLLITGDISFFYDSNAFWNAHVPKNLKIILINNGGGNIFKVISGYNNTEQIERHFVTHQTAKVQKICEAFGIGYLSAHQKNELHTGFQALFASEKCTVMEIFTPSDESAQAFKDFIVVHKK